MRANGKERLPEAEHFAFDQRPNGCLAEINTKPLIIFDYHSSIIHCSMSYAQISADKNVLAESRLRCLRSDYNADASIHWHSHARLSFSNTRTNQHIFNLSSLTSLISCASLPRLPNKILIYVKRA